MLSENILNYYQNIQEPDLLPAYVETMNPFKNAKTLNYASQFYQKFYHDDEKRFICFGINPGRFGAGITGVPFTDPLLLEQVCGIPNDLDKKAELSARFIHEMIQAYGGPIPFYKKYYISAVSPLGFVQNGVNLNYYDIKGFKSMFETYAVSQIKLQMKFGLHESVAFSIGKGQNVKYLNYLNQKYNLFDQIVPLPHPRWVMQYRLKRKQEFIDEYLTAFATYE
ncbi:MAG: hypothetical protein ACI8QD_002009 [Cyclobacteriaceae bacterium]|jgi:hypothetical protein